MVPFTTFWRAFCLIGYRITSPSCRVILHALLSYDPGQTWRISFLVLDSPSMYLWSQTEGVSRRAAPPFDPNAPLLIEKRVVMFDAEHYQSESFWIYYAYNIFVFRYTLFDSEAAGIELKYQTAFSDTMWAFATLFQLMTLDHWLETLMVCIYSVF